MLRRGVGHHADTRALGGLPAEDLPHGLEQAIQVRGLGRSRIAPAWMSGSACRLGSPPMRMTGRVDSWARQRCARA
jgi:hypothetical protein